jgi:hypothetical protein
VKKKVFITVTEDGAIKICKPKPAEVIPHPAFGRRLAEEAIAKATEKPIDRFGAEMIYKRAINEYHRRLESIGVAEHRIDAELAALESRLLPKPIRRRA